MMLVSVDFLYNSLTAHIPIFPGKDIFIGRDEDAWYEHTYPSIALTLTSSSSPFIESTIVSRVHFRIYSVIYDDDLIIEFPPLIYCEDRQSSNGTYVNDTLVGTFNSPRSPYLLNDGDVISIRPHWTFQFHQKKQSNGKNLDDLQRQEVEVLLPCALLLHQLISL
jgi:pSer/pThr/pTyr-binding forkhead associated (FHA) protein